jgi:phenylacetate-coenzyme A ligase PaaK-like adenylate-forming protein
MSDGVTAGATADLLTRHRADVGDAMFAAVRRLRWSEERLRAERERRLREMLAWASERSPFHAERLAGVDSTTFTEDDLPSLPVMTKADLTGHFDRILTDRELTLELATAHIGRHDADDYLLGRYRVFYTSGTTGGRALFVFGWDDWTTFVTMANRWRGRDGSDLPLDAPIASLFASSTKHISGALHEFSKSDAADAPSMTHLPPTLPLAEIVAGVNAAQPVVLQGYPSSIGLLALEAAAGRVHISPQRVLTCGEQCTDATRAAVADAWGVTIDDYWGCSEGAYAFPCSARDGMHLPDDLVIVEPVDHYGNVVAPGRPAAKIYLTNLYNRVQPLIRYEITDAMTLMAGSCSCGCAHRRITDLAGRGETVFAYEGGAVVHCLVVESALLNDPTVGDVQVTQTRRGADVALIARGGCDPEQVRRRLVDLMAGSGLPDPEVTIRVVDRLDQLWSGKVSKFRAL